MYKTFVTANARFLAVLVILALCTVLAITTKSDTPAVTPTLEQLQQQAAQQQAQQGQAQQTQQTQTTQESGAATTESSSSMQQ